MTTYPATLSTGWDITLKSYLDTNVVTFGTAVQTVPSGKTMRIAATDSTLFNLDQADQGDAIVDQIDIRVRSTGDGIAVYHDGGASASTGITTGNVASFLSIIPFYIDEHGSGRDGTIANPRWGRTGLWSIVQPPNRNDIAIKVQSWSNVPAVQILNQEQSFATGNGRAMDIVDNGTDSTVFISKGTTAVGSPSNPKTRTSVLKLQDLTTGGTDPALGTPMQVIGIDDGTGYRFEVDSIGAVRWAAYNASASFDTQMHRASGGTLGMPSIQFDDSSGNGTVVDGMVKVNASHILRLYINSGLQMEWRNGQIGFFGATAASKPTVTGSKGANAALGSLLTALAGLGLLTDSST